MEKLVLSYVFVVGRLSFDDVNIPLSFSYFVNL